MVDFNMMFHTDTEGRKWLVMVTGSGEVLNIPSDVYGIAGSAFSMCRGIKEIHIPLSVEEIGADAFGCFDEKLTVYCAAAEKPRGWADGETPLNSDESGCEMLHNYWLGNAKFTFDANGILTYLPYRYRDGAPKVLWGQK